MWENMGQLPIPVAARAKHRGFMRAANEEGQSSLPEADMPDQRVQTTGQGRSLSTLGRCRGALGRSVSYSLACAKDGIDAGDHPANVKLPGWRGYFRKQRLTMRCRQTQTRLSTVEV